MSQEVWNIIMWASGSLGFGVAITRLLMRWTRSKPEKTVDNANARIAGVQADKAELELWEEERESLLKSKNWWLSEFNRVDKLLVDYKRESDEKLESMAQEIRKLRVAYDEAVEQKEKYKGLLGRLVAEVIRDCGKTDLSEYKQALRA